MLAFCMLAPTKGWSSVDFRISLGWPIHVINPVVKTELSCNTPAPATQHHNSPFILPCSLSRGSVDLTLQLLKTLIWIWFAFDSMSVHYNFKSYFVAISVVFILIPLVLIAILPFLFKAQVAEQSANTETQQRRQRERNVIKMATAIVLGFICSLLVAFRIAWCPVASNILFLSLF